MKQLINGIWKKNPVFFLMLGLCPTLAVTNSVENAMWMAVATVFVLVGSSTVISAVRSLVPDEVRIPSFIVIIATLVTVANLLMKAYLPEMADRLGIYLMLIVVNCIVLGRALAFAYKNPVWDSFLDALGMGIGFSLALLIISSIREIASSGTWFGIMVNPLGGFAIFALPPGALLVMGLVLGFNNRNKGDA